MHDLVSFTSLRIIDNCLPFEASSIHAEDALEIVVGCKLSIRIILIDKMEKVQSYRVGTHSVPDEFDNKLQSIREFFLIFDRDVSQVCSEFTLAGVIYVDAS